MNTLVATFRLTGLLSYLANRARMRFQTARERRVEKSIFGHPVVLDTVDLEQKYLAEDCVREPENLFIYKALSRHGLTTSFIDIGANCGHVAASVVSEFERVILFEPNPKLAALLREMFSDFKNVEVKECAVVGEKSVGTIRLTVPEESSGLATLGATHLSTARATCATYDVRAAMLQSETADVALGEAYIKVDVEGFEYEVISSARDLLAKARPIVGFEALTLEAARRCCALFEDCRFYCARFDFLEPGGALTRSWAGILRSVFRGGSISVLEIDPSSAVGLHNFSQIFAVPSEKSARFEEAVRSLSETAGAWNLSKLRTWSEHQAGHVT